MIIAVSDEQGALAISGSPLLSDSERPWNIARPVENCRNRRGGRWYKGLLVDRKTMLRHEATPSRRDRYASKIVIPVGGVLGPNVTPWNVVYTPSSLPGVDAPAGPRLQTISSTTSFIFGCPTG